MAVRLRGGRHYAWGTTLKKVDKTIAQCAVQLPTKSQFIKQKIGEAFCSPIFLFSNYKSFQASQVPF
jgi:hypothetical protein